MIKLSDSNHYRRDPDVALHLALTLEPTGHIVLDNNEVITPDHPSIDYRRDSLLEIHKRLCVRWQIAMAHVD